MPILLALVALAGRPDADTTYLYRTLLLRAAPGHLLEVIDLTRGRIPVLTAGGDAAPWIMRHRQGDAWDLLLLYPMGSYPRFYSPDRVMRREQASARSGTSGPGFEASLAALVSEREEVFVLGPPPAVVGATLDGAGLYHIEMFVALPDRRADLFHEREMENAYLATLGRPTNLIFTRVGGASWDAFTIGAYRDMTHFAASDTIAVDRQDSAARRAGFESASTIGTDLRALIQRHHDTLAGAVR
ncbi:MAG TPA: hypothetical protein VGA37_11760 [Gemmatimonadales bacterium]